MSAPLDISREERVEQLAVAFDFESPYLRDENLIYEVYQRLRETQPVKLLDKQPRRPGRAWLVTKYRDVHDVFRDDVNYSSVLNTGGGISGPIPEDGPLSIDDVDPYLVAVHCQKIPMALDPPQFSPYRSLLNPLFSPGPVKRKESAARDIARTLISEMTSRDEVEFHHAFAKPLPAMLICRLLGLPEEEWERWAITAPESTGRSVGVDDSREAVMARVVPSVDAQMTMLRIADGRRREPKDDIITAVAHLTVAGRLLNYYEVSAILSILLSGGVHTTTLAIEAALAHLGRNPEMQDTLVQNPELMRPFGEEVLRMWPPFQKFFRVAVNPMAINGQDVLPGDGIIMSIGSANRDSDQFEDPNRFKIDRDPNRHMSFGVGIHRCLGSTLARQELGVAIEEVLTQLPRFTIDEERTSIPPFLFDVHDPTRRLTALFNI